MIIINTRETLWDIVMMLKNLFSKSKFDILKFYFLKSQYFINFFKVRKSFKPTIINSFAMFFDIKRMSSYTQELILTRTHPNNQYWKFHFSWKIIFLRFRRMTFGMSYLKELILESYFNTFFGSWRTCQIFTTTQSNQNWMFYITWKIMFCIWNFKISYLDIKSFEFWIICHVM